MQSEAACPSCGVLTSRVHSRYERILRDLPIQVQRVTLTLKVRKFFCDESQCDRRIFCERLDGVAEAHARRTVRLHACLTRLALLVSSTLASRIGKLTGMPGSARTFLRCAHAYEPPARTAELISIDDFAFRRGHHYGTIILNLETREPIEVLPDRSTEVVMEYLQAHPEIRVVARDRDARYAEAIRWAAPQADVILDRWHLLRNYTDAFERLVARRHATWRTALREHTQANTQLGEEAAAADAESVDLPPPPQHRPSRRIQEQRQAKREARQEVFNRVHELRKLGKPKAAIARELGIDPQTVNTYLRRDAPPDFTRKTPTPSQLDGHAEYLRRRWKEGVRNAAHLTHEIRERGYQGSLRSVMRYVHSWRTTLPPSLPRPPPPRLPTPRRLAWILLTHDPDPALEPAITTLLEASPAAQYEINLAREGHDALRNRDLHAWCAWSERTRNSACNDLKSLVNSLEAEGSAFTNALELPYSNGPTEGHVNRLKLIKRTMYGRASFPLLRKKTLYRDA